MEDYKRATVDFDSDVHRAFGLKAAASERSVSDLVNDAAKAALAEDAEDLVAFLDREREKSYAFAAFAQGLKQRGRI